MYDNYMDKEPIFFFRSFWDQYLFKDGSYIFINGEKLPLLVFVGDSG